MLKLGGIENSSPKTEQSLGRFRVARNVYPTPDGRLIPRYDYGSSDSLPVDTVMVSHIAQYNTDKLYYTAYSQSPFTDSYTRMLKNGVEIPAVNYIGYPSLYSTLGDYSQSIQSYRRNNTTYFYDPSYGILSKYDGVEVSFAGASQPEVFSGSYTSAGTKWIKVIKHTIDFDNNEPISDAVTFPVAAATTPVVLSKSSGLIGSTNVEPKFPSEDKVSGYTGFSGTVTYNAINNDFPIATGIFTSGGATVGSYLVVAINKTQSAFFGFLPLSDKAVGVALKIKVLDPIAPNFVLDTQGAKYLTNYGEWKDFSISPTDAAIVAPQIVRAGREFWSVWASTSKTGVYNYQALIHSPIGLTDNINVTVANPPVIVAGSDDVIVTLGPILNDIYDITSVKVSPNVYRRGFSSYTYLPVGMTVFQDLMLWYDEDLIYFSDTTLGGSFEQGSGQNVFRVGDFDQGRVTSVAGTSDFLVVCRERRNYYVTGNIATGNYRVQEIVEAEIGAWSNSCAVNIKDSIIFLTATGVYQVVSGGKATKLSSSCPKQFSTYDSNNINEDVSFRLTGFNSELNTGTGSISVAYDEFRELLVFMKKGPGSPCLVLHTKTGEFYEWDGLMEGRANQTVSTISFMYGEYLIGGIIDVGITNGAQTFKENSALIPSYRETHPVKLYSTWLTGGEPSLEKILLQVKIFGRIETSGSNKLQIAHYKDWNINTKITSTEYAPRVILGSINDQVQYSHKQRLNSDKVLAASVGIELNSGQSTFEIESFEVEFNTIQEGMKK
jgi:hypothetical protein